ncbi:glutaredoxin 2, partial [Francisella tularensis subsp. holarctica]|nr:glutaredoxin 2 [Francisella tularensis subsp. holarctica]
TRLPVIEKDDGTFNKESDEICKFIAKVQNFEIAESSIDDFVKGCIADLEPHYRRSIYPRIPHHPRNECDFPTQSAKEYF